MNLTPAEQLDVCAALDGENELGWVVEESVCDRCSHEWIAVYPLATDEIDCPNCGYAQPTQELTQL